MMDLENVSASVLRNRGVPVPLHAMGGDGQPLFADDDKTQPVREERWLRFDNNMIAEIETWYGGQFEEIPVVVEGPPDQDGKPTQIQVTDQNGDVVLQKVPRRVEAVFDEQLRGQTTHTVRRVFALMFGVPEQEAGVKMLQGHADMYAAALVGAWAIAQGVEPESAKKAMTVELRMRTAMRLVGVAAIEEMAAEILMAESTGLDSSKPGSKRNTIPPGSGG